MRKPIIWSVNEDKLILENFKLFKSKKWKSISNLLKDRGYNKKQTECRQRYINHLVPSLNKNKLISDHQLYLLYQKYDQCGPKWTLIQSFLPQITQVKLKNIFYGNLRYYIKKIIKFFTNKTAAFVNRLDTFTLQDIYSGRRNFRGIFFLKDDMEKMNYRYNENRCYSLIEERQDDYFRLLNAIFQHNVAKKSKNYQQFLKICIKRSEARESIIKISGEKKMNLQLNGLQNVQNHQQQEQKESDEKVRKNLQVDGEKALQHMESCFQIGDKQNFLGSAQVVQQAIIQEDKSCERNSIRQLSAYNLKWHLWTNINQWVNPNYYSSHFYNQ